MPLAAASMEINNEALNRSHPGGVTEMSHLHVPSPTMGCTLTPSSTRAFLLNRS